MNKRVLKFKNFCGEEIEAIPKLFLYNVFDFTKETLTIPGIQLYTMEDGSLEAYATLTKCFGEFIGLKNSAYVDVNNCYFAPQILASGVAYETGLTKESGFCSYPLWVFDKEFLNDIGGTTYERYSKKYDEYMMALEKRHEHI